VQHHIQSDSLGPAGAGMARAVSTCVHCGFCLAACPTYRVLGEEMDSPRGRIVLMKQALEDELRIADALPYIDRCLGCLACETACPSGVRYRDLVVPFRALAERQARSTTQRLTRQLLLSTLESPARFRMAATVGKIARGISMLLPAQLKAMVNLLPHQVPSAESPPELTPAVGPRRARVALLAGCVQQVLRPSINAAAIRLLSANGVEVLVPRGQGCCGALALHSGFDARAGALARRNAEVFPVDVDAIVTTAAGCGSTMKEASYRSPVQDIAEFLDRLGVQASFRIDAPIVVAYHDACHLAHGQDIRSAPRRLLQRIENVSLRELTDGEMCCGSAGLYNLEHPDTASALGRRKADAIRATGAAMVATGNIGCLTQIETYLPEVPVRHVIEVLDSAYSAGDSPRS
jgi:glycolate dehydrogenase iron-sulfur subunit